MKLTDEQFDEYRRNLLLHGIVFIQVNYNNGDLEYKILDNKSVRLEPEQDANPR